MLHSKNSQAQAIKEQQNHIVSVLEYNGANIAFEEIKGKIMVNATQMAQPFGKRTRDWLITQQSKDLIKTVSETRNLASTDLQYVKKGGSNQGTWFQKDIAMFFAQWLSPEFYLACNLKLEELLSKKAMELPVKHGITPIINQGTFFYPYTEALRALGASTKGSSARRKAKHPDQFIKMFGRNFITAKYFDMLKSFYDYKLASNQLKLAL